MSLLIKSTDVIISVTWRVLVVCAIPLIDKGTLIWTKNLLKEFVIGKLPSNFALLLESENKVLISSICIALLVLHSK